MTFKLSTAKLLAGAAIIALLTMAATIVFAGGKSEAAAIDIVRSWNAAGLTLGEEDANFHELLDSYKLNPPGKVILTPDVRAEQRKRRLNLIGAIVESHQQRIVDLQQLAKAEAALP